MRRFATLLAAASFLAGLGPAGTGAQSLYRWTDGEGRVHYGDRPPGAAAEVKPPVAPAGAVGPGLRFEFYDVRGRSVNELHASILDNGPRDEPTGKRYGAYTRWNVKWQYRWTNDGTVCRLSRIAVTLEGFTRMPRWADAAQATAEVRESWARYYEALRRHEEGHYAIGAEARDAIERALWSVPPSRDCKALEREADRVARALLAEYAARDRAYDQRTDNGRKEGVVLD